MGRGKRIHVAQIALVILPVGGRDGRGNRAPTGRPYSRLRDWL